jgi:hypothetical protein
MQVSVYNSRLPLRRSRTARLRRSLSSLPSSLPSVPTRRRQRPPWQLVGAVVLPIAALAAVGYVARRRFYLGVAVFAKAVEEVADAVEDAAEDLGDAAKARADQDEGKK